MDNLTHSVVGLGIGALIDRTLAPEPDTVRQGRRQRLLLTLCCLASNFPDLDLVATRLLERPLGYLLLHRGHTHTLVGVLVEMVVLLGLTWLLWPNARRLVAVSAAARSGAVLATALGMVLHIAMDGLNVYGVHPFWPFDARWFYGDLVFIVEPVFWVAFGVPLLLLLPARWARALLLGFMTAVLAAFTVEHYLLPGSLAGLLGLGALLAAVGIVERRHGAAAPDGMAAATPVRRPRTALVAGLAVALAFIGVQAAAMHRARDVIGAELARLDPGERLLDTALSGYPANPLCWSVTTVAVDAARGTYRTRRGLVSIAPGLQPVWRCPARIAGGAPVDNRQLAWLDNDRQSLDLLRRADRLNCHLNAWMRFARAPVLEGGSATDARWSGAGGRTFATLDYAARADKPCPQGVPGWGVPRADLLDGR